MVRQAVRKEAGPANRHTTSTRRKSSVWEDFDYVEVPGASATATCKRCGSMFQASSKKHGTSTLRRHAKSTCCAKRAAQRAAPCLQAAAPAADDDKDDEEALASQQAGPCLPAAAPTPAPDDDEEALATQRAGPCPQAAAPTPAPDDDKEALATQQAGPYLPAAAAAPAPDDDLEWRAMENLIDDLHKNPEYDADLFSREEQQHGGIITTTSSPSTDLATTESHFTNGDHHRCSPNHGMPDTHMPQAHSTSSRRFFRRKRERQLHQFT
ncbi:hypothetical protein ACQ4PT_022230 [Festuca glaucescens]